MVEAANANLGIQQLRAGSETRPLLVLDLGVIGYEPCWKLQNDLAAAVAAGERPETLLLLEHPHTYTCGRRGGRDHLLVSDEQLAREGITVLDVDRGGDITYHGPGQLVAYPVIDLHRQWGAIDYHAYLRLLEEALIGTLAYFSITASRVPGYSGVWAGLPGREEKIAAIGVKVDARGITTHGIALNVATDLSFFHRIIPCGISDRGVTSMAVLLGRAPDLSEVKAAFTEHFCRSFGFRPERD